MTTPLALKELQLGKSQGGAEIPVNLPCNGWFYKKVSLEQNQVVEKGLFRRMSHKGLYT